MCWYSHLERETVILLSLAISLVTGFLMTRLTKKLRLPNVSGYIIAGILIGPGVLGLVPQATIDNMDYVSDIALAFIAFGVGKFFQIEKLRETGGKVIFVTLLESLLAGAMVAGTVYCLFHLDLAFALLLGAIATATAPASTMMTIDQYHARGPFVNLLLQIVALDDVVCLLVFSIAAALVSQAGGGVLSAASILAPIVRNLAVLLLGGLFAVLLSKLLSAPGRSSDNRLILTIALLLALCGICAILQVSPLLSCMVFGAGYINLTRDKALFQQITAFKAPVMSLFFVVSGMNLDIQALATFGTIGVVYFLVRIAGKYGGAWLGCAAMKLERSTRNWLGLALVPQAGVAIGLAYLGRRILPEAYGDLLMTIILASSVLYELIGPACAKLALLCSGVIREEPAGDPQGAIAAENIPQTADPAHK